ncbi:unnamed protein product [Cyclocybe aegerita]|uniref:Uncharacterized protein n=1 Tax=Cyclocybe aegerita TaxID=1973307 RepID=A0A8S0VW90_CYCAE|nr:unnamed protein product [Cyclocybe aegerita]
MRLRNNHLSTGSNAQKTARSPWALWYHVQHCTPYFCIAVPRNTLFKPCELWVHLYLHSRFPSRRKAFFEGTSPIQLEISVPTGDLTSCKLWVNGGTKSGPHSTL